MSAKLIPIFLALPLLLSGQTRVDLQNQARAGTGTVLPAACVPGQTFYKANTLLLYFCTQVNTWALWGTGGGGLSPIADQTLLGNISGSSAIPIGITATQVQTFLAGKLAPFTHHASHQNGGADEVATGTPGAYVIPKTGTSGLLAIGFVASGSPTGTKFVRDDGVLAVPSGSGTGSNAVLTPVSFSATPTFTVSGSSTPQVFTMTLTGNVTSSTLNTTGATAGQPVSFILTQDGTGGRTFAWPSNVMNACAISGTLSVSTTVTGIFDGTNVNATGCTSNDPATIVALGPTRAALSTPPASNVGCWLDSTANTQECIDPSGYVTRMVRVWSGTAAMGTGAISSAACATDVTVTATGVLTTDVIDPSFNGQSTGVVGYQPLTSGMLSIRAWPSADHVNFTVCNATGGSITPGAITLNWRVAR